MLFPMKKKRISFNSAIYTTTISLMLVLLMIGLETVIIVSSQSIIKGIKEEVFFSVVVRDDADSTQLARLERTLALSDFCKNLRYVSKEEALQEHIKSLGADPTKYIGYNPLYASYEVRLNADYANPESLQQVEEKMKEFPFVDEVIYPSETIELLNKNIQNLSLIILVISVVLLVIAWVLISNTVRLHIYSKRFLIKTMQLVGATPYVIKKPFIQRSIIMGIVATIMAIGLLFLLIYYVNQRFDVLLITFSPDNIAIIVSVVLLSGILITTLASTVQVGRFIRMDKNTIYEI